MDLTDKIVKGLEDAGIILMPFLKGDAARERHLHEIGNRLKLHVKTIHGQRNERYDCVLLEKTQQPKLW